MVTPRELAEEWEPWAIAGLRAWFAEYDEARERAQRERR